MSVITSTKKAGELVNTQHVDMLISNYKKERWVANSKKIGKGDSLSVWYGLNELQDFLNKAREHGADGIRMYFGAYPNQYEKNSAVSNQQTLVLVATKTKADASGGTVNKHIYYQTEQGMEVLAFNMGSICPPFCGGGYGNAGFIVGEGLGLSLLDDQEGGVLVV
jgi:hypothetical protein